MAISERLLVVGCQWKMILKDVIFRMQFHQNCCDQNMQLIIGGML